MAKKKAKERQRHYIEKGMDLASSDETSDKNLKRRVRKPKMPAKINTITSFTG